MSDEKKMRAAYDACLAAGIRPPEELLKLFAVPRAASFDDLTGEEAVRMYGVEWPSPDKDVLDGAPFTEVRAIESQAHHETLHYLAPHYPDRRVPVEWDFDDYGDRFPIAWRDMTEEEWQEALAAYTRANEEWQKTGGRVIRKVQEPTISATFATEDGGEARGIWVRGRGKKKGHWYWTEWSTCSAPATGPGAMWPDFRRRGRKRKEKGLKR